MDSEALAALIVGRSINEAEDCHRLSARHFVRSEEWKALKAHEQYHLRCVAVCAMASKAVLVSRSAAQVSDMWVLSNTKNLIELALPSGHPPAKRLWPAGVVFRSVKVLERDIVTTEGPLQLRYTTGPRTAIDIARLHGHHDGVVAFDSLLKNGDIDSRRETWQEIHRTINRMAGKKGIEKARAAFKDSTHLSESPFESLLRIILSEHGIEVELQMWIGKYRVDMLWGTLIIEVDGKVKFEDQPHAVVVAQLERENWLKEQVYEVIRITTTEILKNPAECVERILKAKELADARGPARVPAHRESPYERKAWDVIDG